ncbi:MAG: xanthine dehydrogenase family protein subunit M [Elusimicrobiaceae bacterium]
MPITHEFEYYKPQKLDEALKLKAERPGASVLAGGTDLIVRLKNGLDKPAAVVDVKGVKELSVLELSGDVLTVGACVTFSELIESPLIKKHFPLIMEAAMTVASVGVRNRATMTGNICSAVPSCDSATCLLVYEAAVCAVSVKREREIPIAEWFLGPRKTALGPDEIVQAVKLRLPEKKNGACYAKLSRYEGEDLAQAGISVFVDSSKNYRIALSAVCPAPKRLPAVENFLSGKRPTEKVLSEAVRLLAREICAITDIRATVEYREHMTKVMFRRAVAAAFSRLENHTPAYGTRVV